MCTREPLPSGCLRQLSSNGARTNRCQHVPSGSTCGRRLRTYATGSIAVPSPPHIPLACRAHQSECGWTAAARGRRKGRPASMDPHETTRPTRPDAPPARRHRPRAHSAPRGRPWEISATPTSRTLPGPAVPVPQHRSRPDRPSHRVLRPRRAGRRANHAQDSPVSTRPVRRRGGHRHHQPGDLGPPPHGHARRPLGLARHRARLSRPPARESSPPGLLRADPNTSPSAPTSPPRGRTSSTSPTTPGGASRRSSASPGRRSTRPAASSGSRQGARRPWWGGCSPSHNPLPRP